MNNIEAYFVYYPPNGGAVFVGNNKEQIKQTVKHYADRGDQKELVVPTEREILELQGDINVTVALTMAHVDHNVSARVRPRAVFHVNANAIDYVQRVASDYEKLKRGDLFKFEPGLSALGLYFLPEDVMQGLRSYDWSQHQSQIEKWLTQRDVAITEGRRRGFLA